LASSYHIINIFQTHHLYIDGTFLTMKEFYQKLITMYYHEKIEKKIPGCFILINSKEKNSYITALNSYNTLITKENTKLNNIYTICTDFEINLIEDIKLVFKDVRHVSSLFH
jgi:hypothetical protein